MSPRVAFVALLVFLIADGTPIAGREPRTDRYGDPLPAGAIVRLGTARFRIGHTSYALSHDGKILATAEADRLRLWRVPARAEIRSVKLPDAWAVSNLLFSPDDKCWAIVTRRWDKDDRMVDTLCIGETATGRIVYQASSPQGGLGTIAFSPDGKLIVARNFLETLGVGWGPPSREPIGLIVWDVTRKRELRRVSQKGCYAISPDSKILAIGDEDGTIRLEELVSGRELGVLKGHRAAVWCLAFSPDGKLLVSGGGDRSNAIADIFEKGRKEPERDNSVLLWDVTAKKVRFRCEGHNYSVEEVAFSPNGKAFVSKDQYHEKLILWDAATGQQRRVAEWGDSSGRWTTFGFSPDGSRLLAVGRDGRVHEWELPGGAERRIWGEGHAWIVDPVFAADGKTVLTGGDRLRLWDATTGMEIKPYESHNTYLTSLEFSADSRFLASQDEDHWLRLWETRTGRCLPLGGRRRQRVFRFAFAEDGKTLAAVGDDLRLRVWEVATGRKRREAVVGSAVMIEHWDKGNGPDFDYPDRHLVFSPDRRTLAIVDEHEDIHLWDVTRGVRIRRLLARQGENVSLTFSPDSKYLAAVGEDAVIRLWSLPSGEEIQQFHGEEEQKGFVAFSPDGKRLAWAWNGRIRLWDLARRQETGRTLIHPGRIQCLSFDRDSQTLVSADREVIRVWDTTAGQMVRTVGAGNVGYRGVAAIGPPWGRLLYFFVESKSSYYALRDVATGREIIAAEGRGVRRCAVSPDGLTLARATDRYESLSWNPIELREVATGGALAELAQGHQREVTVLAFSPDGRYLASGSADSTVIIWDAKGGHPFKGDNGEENRRHDRAALWADLAANDARKAHRAMAELTTEGDTAATFLRERLRPANRADGDAVRRLCADLDSPQFVVRERASRRLAKLTAEAEPVLRETLRNKPSLEVRRRLEPILSDPQITRWSADSLREMRAVQVLEQIGTVAARRVLRALADGEPEARLTRDAKAALARLARQPASPP